MSVVTLTDDFLEAAIELRYVQSEQKKLEQQEKRCKEILAKCLIAGDVGIDANGQALVKMAHGSQLFKPELATANLPPAVLDTISITIPNGARAKQVLAPALYELCCQEGQPSVRVV